MTRVPTAIVVTGLIVASAVLFSCQATVGNASVWARPAVRIPPRATELGDGEQVFVEGYDPRGDSFLIVIRVSPKGEKGKQALSSSQLGSWPEKVKKRFKK
jgi:hypothetical protein